MKKTFQNFNNRTQEENGAIAGAKVRMFTRFPDWYYNGVFPDSGDIAVIQ